MTVFEMGNHLTLELCACFGVGISRENNARLAVGEWVTPSQSPRVR